MTKTKRYPAVPLVTHDPYFSLWSPSDKLYESEVVNWTGRKQPLTGTARIDGTVYRFMGLDNSGRTMEQTGFDLTALSSIYTFAAEGIELSVRFTSPLLPDDLDLVSRPVTYLSFSVRPMDGKTHSVDLSITMDESHCRGGDNPENMVVREHKLESLSAISLGKAKQTPLNHSGDGITIDWGYLYLAVGNDSGHRLFTCDTEPGSEMAIGALLQFHEVSAETSARLLLAYDDTASLVYFGETYRGYWAREGRTIFEALEDAERDYQTVMERCTRMDEEVSRSAKNAISGEYAEILSLAFRQSIAAHKLIADRNGHPVFLSKECHSNGCIGTVDVSYPSVPLYLLYNPELVKGMIRPVLTFARRPVWEYDFAPHDVGRYPYANGQIYALNSELAPGKKDGQDRNDTIPPYYSYPKGSNLYDFDRQMPVEECGNMLIMAAALYRADGDLAFVGENRDLYGSWVRYLLEYGRDPGNQLCTDDFAGHLAHNANLAAKAVLGIASYAILLEALGEKEEAEGYRKRSESLAADWEERVFLQPDHSALTFDRPESWGQKYNLIWDLVLETNLFSPRIFARETAWYLRKQDKYGVPLDNRAKYTKSDWILWCASFAESKEDRAALIRPVFRFLRETPDRVPFSDWYETDTGRCRDFQNRTVQGGLFMPLLRRS